MYITLSNGDPLVANLSHSAEFRVIGFPVFRFAAAGFAAAKFFLFDVLHYPDDSSRLLARGSERGGSVVAKGERAEGGY